jgi:hypothetical protein
MKTDSIVTTYLFTMLYNGVVKGGTMKTKWIRVGGLEATKDECHETWTYGPRSSGDWP